jgi:MFS family permease
VNAGGAHKLVEALSLDALLTCITTAFGGLLRTTVLAAVTEMAGEQIGGASSILNTGAQVGGFFAPMLTPFIAGLAGWSWGLYAGCLIALSGAVAVGFVRLRPIGSGVRTAHAHS